MTRYAQQQGRKARLLVLAPYQGQPTRDLGVFEKMDGGELDTEDVRYGEAPVGAGVASRGDVTLKRRWTELSSEEESWLESARGARCVITRFDVGDDRLELGSSKTMLGVIKGVSSFDGDVTGSERGELTVVCGVDV